MSINTKKIESFFSTSKWYGTIISNWETWAQLNTNRPGFKIFWLALTFPVTTLGYFKLRIWHFTSLRQININMDSIEKIAEYINLKNADILLETLFCSMFSLCGEFWYFQNYSILCLMNGSFHLLRSDKNCFLEVKDVWSNIIRHDINNNIFYFFLTFKTNFAFIFSDKSMNHWLTLFL